MVDVRLTASPQDTAIYNSRLQAEMEFGVPSSNCVQLDEQLKRVVDKIADYTKNANYDKTLLNAYQLKKSQFETAFNTLQCRDKIEKSRLLTGAISVTQGALAQEKEILKKDEKQQNIFIGVGIVGVIVAIYLIAS